MTIRICPTCNQEVDSEELFCPRDGTRLLKPSVYAQIATEADPMVGTRIAGRYLVIRKVGEGGMGDVYLGEHEDIEKQVAIKVLKQEYSARPDIVARFRQEAVSASRIEHPNVVVVFDFGQLEDGRFYLVMEWLEGQDLATLLAEKGKLRPQLAILIAVQACKALEAAHRNGVIHRDLKPENIFLVKNEEHETFVKIVDFGIAKLKNESEGQRDERGKPRKLTKTGMVFGTPEYMSPEQAKGGPADRRSDVYAMGIVIFEMITGQVPFFGDTFLGVLTAHMTQVPPLLNDVLTEGFVSNELEKLVSTALAKAPEERFQDMKQLRDALLGAPESKEDAEQGHNSTSQMPISLVRPKQPSRVVVTNDPNASVLGETKMQLEVPGIPTRQRNGKALVAVLAVVGLIGVAAGITTFVHFKATGSSSAVPSEDIARRPHASATSSVATRNTNLRPLSTVTPSASASSSSPVAPVVSAPTSNVIHIITKPPGVVVSKRDGKQLFQVCATTPCDYPAGMNEKITFVARTRGLEGAASVLARTSQDLVIVLRPIHHAAPVRKPEPKKKPRAKTMCRYCEPKGDPDCLYVLRPCDGQ